VGLRHCPSGKFNADAAWPLTAALAHNLLRWVAAIELGVRGELVATKTLRRTLLNADQPTTASLMRHLPQTSLLRPTQPYPARHESRRGAVNFGGTCRFRGSPFVFWATSPTRRKP
jgi:hypothetical protein